MITQDPYGISHARAPWKSPTRAPDSKRDAEFMKQAAKEAEICGTCRLPDCNPKCFGCLLLQKRKRQAKRRDVVDRMALKGATAEEIAAATGYTVATAAEYSRQTLKEGPCEHCPSLNVCQSYRGTCSLKELWTEINRKNKEA